MQQEAHMRMGVGSGRLEKSRPPAAAAVIGTMAAQGSTMTKGEVDLESSWLDTGESASGCSKVGAFRTGDSSCDFGSSMLIEELCKRTEQLGAGGIVAEALTQEAREAEARGQVEWRIVGRAEVCNSESAAQSSAAHD